MFAALATRMRRRGQAWIARRTPLRPAPMTLDRKRIYILPTRGGLFFGLLVFVMLLGAMNYSNSLAFSLCFLLAGIGLVCMHHTHRNLVNLRLQSMRQNPVFAGDEAEFQLQFHNPSRAHRFAVNIDHGESEQQHCFDVPAAGDTLASVRVKAPRRGKLAAPRLRIHTRFPMGLFRAWSWAHLDIECLVYPRPNGRFKLPAATAGDQYGQTELHAGREDFAGLRKYQFGDPPRLIHWKAYPRSGQLMVKQFADPRESELWLDWNLAGHRDSEIRLSQLTRWVLEADRLGLTYGLRLPDKQIPCALGANHRRRCLRELALHDNQPANATRA